MIYTLKLDTLRCTGRPVARPGVIATEVLISEREAAASQAGPISVGVGDSPIAEQEGGERPILGEAG